MTPRTSSRRKELTPAGRLLEARLKEVGLTRAGLVREMNRHRAARGIAVQMVGSTLWYWTTADAASHRRINIDDATLIEIICGFPVTAWSRYWPLAAAGNPAATDNATSSGAAGNAARPPVAAHDCTRVGGARARRRNGAPHARAAQEARAMEGQTPIERKAATSRRAAAGDDPGTPGHGARNGASAS